MRLTLAAVGVLKRGPERELIDDYLARAQKLARGVGVLSVSERQLSAGDTRAEASDALRAAVPENAHLVLLDERGAALSSRELAQYIAHWRDEGQSACYWLIGGADGVDDALRARANQLVSFGRATWPHRLARVMAAEQIYRALSVLAGAPYHRD